VIFASVQFDRQTLLAVGEVQPIGLGPHVDDPLSCSMGEARHVEDVEVPPYLQLAFAACVDQVGQFEELSTTPNPRAAPELRADLCRQNKASPGGGQERRSLIGGS
jgi:hypothetical protein